MEVAMESAFSSRSAALISTVRRIVLRQPRQSQGLPRIGPALCRTRPEGAGQGLRVVLEHHACQRVERVYADEGAFEQLWGVRESGRGFLVAKALSLNLVHVATSEGY